VCAQRFARAGHRVIVTGRDEAALREVASADGVRALTFDVTDPDGWERVDEAVDVLVASAGIASTAPVQRTSLEDWRRMLEVNVTGVFLGARTVLPGMIERDWGRIVAIASTASHRGVRYGSGYSASKHAVLGLVRSIAMEVAGTGVTANSVCPGFAATAMTDRSVARIARTTGLDEAEARASLIRMQPLGRLVEPAEVAGAVAYLAGEEASAVNGQSIVLDGGGIQQ
jgi:NAD(P)-dependent dehydrogenase (short-subunit alcohol dehydrogenase family)